MFLDLSDNWYEKFAAFVGNDRTTDEYFARHAGPVFGSRFSYPSNRAMRDTLCDIKINMEFVHTFKKKVFIQFQLEIISRRRPWKQSMEKKGEKIAGLKFVNFSLIFVLFYISQNLSKVNFGLHLSRT